MRSPKLKAIPWVFERIRMYPANLPSSFFSTETLTNASSPNTLEFVMKKTTVWEQRTKCEQIMYRSNDIKIKLNIYRMRYGRNLIVQMMSENEIETPRIVIYSRY
jgi:hypothetical protein